MLQRAPDAGMTYRVSAARDDGVFCAQCQNLVTRSRWQLSVGGHEHRCVNPHGRIFDVRCYQWASGVVLRGEPTATFTWFSGYLWSVTHCSHCHIHMGWHFSGGDDPQQFFGLIYSRLSDGLAATDRPAGR